MTRYSRYSSEDVSQALDAIKGGQSLRKAASQWGVPRTTLQRRMQGAQSREIAFSEQQRLSQAQESNLAEWVRIQVVLGLPPTYHQIREFAERILQTQGDSKPLGKNWVQSFIRRNPSVKSQRSKDAIIAAQVPCQARVQIQVQDQVQDRAQHQHQPTIQY